MTVAVTAVAVSRAASSESTLGITDGTAEVLTTSSISPGGSIGVLWGGWLAGGGRGVLSIVATGDTASSAMSGSITAPSVGTAAGTLIDGAVGSADPVLVGRSTGSVGGDSTLTLVEREITSENDLGADLVVDIGLASVVLRAELTTKTVGGEGRSKLAGRLDIVEVDVGQRGTREGREGQEGPHIGNRLIVNCLEESKNYDDFFVG